jgi:hypothetical protein
MAFSLSLPPLAAEIAAGYIGGSAKSLAFYPLDTLTTLREVNAPEDGRSFLEYYAGCGMTMYVQPGPPHTSNLAVPILCASTSHPHP